MSRNDIINTDGTIKWDTVGGFKDSIDNHTAQLVDIRSEVIYVKSTDNLQTVFDNLVGNQTIYLRDSDYTITNPLAISSKNLITIKGNGRAKITFTGTGDILTITNSNNINIENVSIIGSGTGVGHGIVFNNSYRGYLKDVLISNVGKDCLNCTNSWWMSTINCVFDYPGTGYSCINHGTNSNNILHLHDKITPRGQYGITITAGYQITISNCDISATEANSIGVNILGVTTGVIRDCYFEALATSIIIGDSTHFVPGIEISNNYIHIGTTGILVHNGSNLNINNNYFLGGTNGISIDDVTNNTNINITSSNYFNGVTNKVVNPNSRATYLYKMPTPTTYNPVTVTGNGGITLDLKNNSNFLVTISDTSTNKTITFSNLPASGNNIFSVIYLILDYQVAANISYSQNISWDGGTAPTYTAGKKHLLRFVTWGGPNPIMGKLEGVY